MSVPAVWSALLWGAGSAATFPAGALVGLHFSMSHTHLGLLMAFGAGTLIFAVSVEVGGLVVRRSLALWDTGTASQAMTLLAEPEYAKGLP